VTTAGSTIDGPAGDLAAQTTWRAVLGELMHRRSLDASQTSWAMAEIMSGEATPAQLAAFAVLLHAKGETAAELSGLARTMLDRAPAVEVDRHCVDIVGTGGDGAHTVNLSTMAALVVAASGRVVVKHGNRAASSRCGTADVLEALGVAIDLPAEGVRRCVERAGIGFCFAPVFHSGLRYAGAPRRELGVPTAFNVLGPLTNPARPSAAAIGCPDVTMAPIMAQVLADRGDSALVFRGDDGLDELTTVTGSHAWIAHAGTVREATVDPRALGLPVPPNGALTGGEAAFNAQVVRDVVAGTTGPVRDAVLLNAAAGIAAFDRDLDDLHDGLSRGLVEAARTVDAGAADQLLQRWIKVSQDVRAELA
jgi:anthranilate phosphoribosyltransferase